MQADTSKILFCVWHINKFCCITWRKELLSTATKYIAVFSGNPPILLLPDSVRIRKYNISSEQYSDYIENEERIQAVDYDWDPEGIGLSEYMWSVIANP